MIRIKDLDRRVATIYLELNNIFQRSIVPISMGLWVPIRWLFISRLLIRMSRRILLCCWILMRIWWCRELKSIWEVFLLVKKLLFSLGLRILIIIGRFIQIQMVLRCKREYWIISQRMSCQTLIWYMIMLLSIFTQLTVLFQWKILIHSVYLLLLMIILKVEQL